MDRDLFVGDPMLEGHGRKTEMKPNCLKFPQMHVCIGFRVPEMIGPESEGISARSWPKGSLQIVTFADGGTAFFLGSTARIPSGALKISTASKRVSRQNGEPILALQSLEIRNLAA
ncbi:MAG TPA: hypothetical protein DEP46_15330 [Blastocatellia bacterium]|nr:hypothetical protein [Blastocatellia bacterium]